MLEASPSDPFTEAWKDQAGKHTALNTSSFLKELKQELK